MKTWMGTTMKTWKGTLLATVAALAISPAANLMAQGPEPAKVHGHVQNAAGQSLTAGEVKFTKDKSGAEKDQKFVYTFPLDGSGNYSATGIGPGDYFVYVTAGDKRVDRLELTIKGGEDKTLDFDMTREEYMKALTPEERKAIEDYKKKNAEASSVNKVIANLNATLNTVRADLKAATADTGDVSKDVESMKNAVAAKADEAILWLTYGDTLQSQGDHLAKAVRQGGKPPASDEATMKTYSDAVDAYKKAVEVSAAAKKPAPLDQSTAYNQMGNTLAKMGKAADSSSAYENAVRLTPTNAGMYYNNEAAVLFNNGKPDEALAAAEKAIAADPNRPDPYFIKGQVLVQKATVDPKTQLPVAPPGCLESYKKYLELAPDGRQASTVKDILTGFGQKIDMKYSAGRKKG